jgi:hypothetical protein
MSPPPKPPELQPPVVDPKPPVVAPAVPVDPKPPAPAVTAPLPPPPETATEKKESRFTAAPAPLPAPVSVREPITIPAPPPSGAPGAAAPAPVPEAKPERLVPVAALSPTSPPTPGSPPVVHVPATTAEPPVKSYSVTSVTVKQGDTFESLCQFQYGDKKYAAALQHYLTDHGPVSETIKANGGLTAGMLIALPPAAILQQEYALDIR